MAAITYDTTYGSYAWSSWCTSSASTSTTPATSNDTWYYWNSTDSSSASTTTAPVSYTTTWVIWNGEQEYVERENRLEDQRYQERLEQARKLRAEAEAAAKKLKEEKEAAEQKAKDLLMDLIGEDELKVYEETGRIMVKGRRFDYILQKEGLVKKIEKDKVVDLCIHLRNQHAYPESDNVIGLKLMIEAEEDELLKRANVHGSRSLDHLKELRAACM